MSKSLKHQASAKLCPNPHTTAKVSVAAAAGALLGFAAGTLLAPLLVPQINTPPKAASTK